MIINASKNVFEIDGEIEQLAKNAFVFLNLHLIKETHSKMYFKTRHSILGSDCPMI